MSVLQVCDNIEQDVYLHLIQLGAGIFGIVSDNGARCYRGGAALVNACATNRNEKPGLFCPDKTRW